ncbi:MAG TPA: YicC family protein [Deltaproteobacteria bacterium]|nr:YicC family protein [Deltaproteobacteria bacterium]
MIKSMTGYGKSETTWQEKKIIVEMKSVNHRFLELSLRLPSVLFSAEAEFKKKISERCRRGRIETSIRLEEKNKSSSKVNFNSEAARGYIDALSRIKNEFNLSGEISLEILASFRDVFSVPDESQLSREFIDAINVGLAEALTMMINMRKAEGAVMCEDMRARLLAIEGIVAEIKTRAPQVVVEYQKRLTERVRELTGGFQLDENRMVQEVAIMAERSDITEEVVRLQSHMKQFAALLGSEEAEGRKIDFLLQEMNREINTIGSKSGDVNIARQVIEVKSEMGKLREQAQNIE